jgi:hypothetical protein
VAAAAPAGPQQVADTAATAANARPRRPDCELVGRCCRVLRTAVWRGSARRWRCADGPATNTTDTCDYSSRRLQQWLQHGYSSRRRCGGGGGSGATVAMVLQAQI